VTLLPDSHSSPEHEPSPLGELGNLEETVVIKDRNLFAISLRDGRIPVHGAHPLGLYYRDCRFLSAHELWIGGALPLPLVASDALGTEVIHEMTNPDLALEDGSGLAAQTLQVRLERRFCAPRTMRDLITVRSHHRAPLQLPMQLRLGADFAPMLAVRGLVEHGRRPAEPRAEGNRIVMELTGRDGVARSTTIALSPGPASWADGVATFALTLAPGGAETVELTYTLVEGVESEGILAGRDGTEPRSHASGWLARHTRVCSDDQLFDRVLRRSLLDLSLLRSELEGHRYYAAGIPWYSTVFGRDSLITAIQTLSFAPEIAEETLRLLGGRLGRTVDDERDEEPGKVVHELREGEVARLAETPLVNYYGTADATPLFLCLLADQADWSGDLSLFNELRPQVDAALAWMDRHGDLDGDGLLEYRSRSPRGLRNHGWKDSHDGVVDEHGVPLEPPIALVEVQGYALRAKRAMARLFELSGEDARAEDLRAGTAVLEEGIERFWLDDLGYYAMALDAAKRPSRALASNQGHLLWADAVPPERAAQVRDALMGDAMFTGWGIRTLADGEPAYNPIGYHIGSVWPHDNALIAVGLRRYGFDEAFTHIFEGLLEAASQFSNYRLPELFAGFSRTEYESPVPYPVACRPQAWAAGAIPYLMQWGFGLTAEGFDRRLRLIRPSLPRWINRVEVPGIPLAGASIDLRFERARETVTLADARIDGKVEVVAELTGQEAGTRAVGA
jgi:glycogen debranching enzyme